MLRHACGYALADKGIDTRTLQGLSRPPLHQLDHALCGVGSGLVQKHLRGRRSFYGPECRRIEEDPDATARLRHRWTPRQGTRTNRLDGWRTPLAFGSDGAPDRPAA